MNSVYGSGKATQDSDNVIILQVGVAGLGFGVGGWGLGVGIWDSGFWGLGVGCRGFGPLGLGVQDLSFSLA
jgi:hypothetical protein